MQVCSESMCVTALRPPAPPLSIHLSISCTHALASCPLPRTALPHSLNKGQTRRSAGSRNGCLHLLVSHPFLYYWLHPSPPSRISCLLVGPLASIYDRSLGLLRFARDPERWVAWDPDEYSLGGVVVSMRLLAAAVRVSSRLQRPSSVEEVEEG